MALSDTIEAVRNGESPEVARLNSVEKKTPFQEKLYNFAKEYALGTAKSGGRVLTSAFDLTYTGGKKALGREPGAMKWENVPVLKNTPSYQRIYETEKEAGNNAPVEVAKAAGEDVLNLAPIKLLQMAGSKGVRVVKDVLKKNKKVSSPTPKIKYDTGVPTKAVEPFKLKTVGDYNPTNAKESMAAINDIYRIARQAFVEGNIKLSELRSVERQVKQMEKLYKNEL